MSKHYVHAPGNREWIDITAQGNFTPADMGMDQYIEGTRTWDSLRYRDGAEMPFEVIFTDRCNVKHKVVLKDKIDQLSATFPCGTEILWHGYERDRTGLDAQTQVAEATFSYAESQSGFIGIGSQPHGIRVQVSGFKSSKTSEASIDTERWTKAISMAKDATEAGKNLASIYNTL